MLALDSTVGCIEASASEVLELHRSATVTKGLSAEAKPAKLEAYVCAIKKKTQVKTYLAIVADDRRIYVYSKPGKADGESDYLPSVQRALDCARSMGFSPEPVDLSYSPAMREVVVRNTKILRPPGSKAGAFLKHGMAGAPILPIAKAAKHTPTPSPPAAPQVSSPRIPATSPPLPATAVASRPPRGNELPGQVPALESTLSQLKEELAACAADRDAHAAQLQQISGQQQAIAAELALARQECARLGAERDDLARYQEQCAGLAREKVDLEGQLRELGLQHQDCLAELSGLREECARLTADKAAMEQAVDGAEKASSELVSLRKEVAVLSGKVEEADRLSLSLGEERTALAEALSLAGQQVEAASAKRDEAFQKAEQLAAENSEAGARIKAVRAELAAALQRMEALEQRKGAAFAELAALRREVVSLRDQQRELPEKEREVPSHSAGETRPSSETILPPPPARVPGAEAQSHAPEGAAEFADFTFAENTGDCASEAVRAPGESPQLPDETQQLPPETRPAPLESRQAPGEALHAPGLAHMADREREFAYYSSMTEETTRFSGEAAQFPPFVDLAPDPSPVAAQAPDFPPLADLHGGDFFSASDDGSEPVRFLLNSKLDAITYSDAEDLVELHQSINNANLAPDGKGQESCRGYICAVKEGGAARVFAAIHGTQSGRTRVYLPQEQPKDEPSYAKTIKGAISFAEEVGLMMEPVKLDAPALQQSEWVPKCPALRKIEKG